MQFYLVSDNLDTNVGLRLAGIPGVLVHEKAEAERALQTALGRKDVGIVLVTSNLVKLCSDFIKKEKIFRKLPLILEIPDRHSTGTGRVSIKKHINEAMGIKI